MLIQRFQKQWIENPSLLTCVKTIQNSAYSVILDWFYMRDMGLDFSIQLFLSHWITTCLGFTSLQIPPLYIDWKLINIKVEIWMNGYKMTTKIGLWRTFTCQRKFFAFFLSYFYRHGNMNLEWIKFDITYKYMIFACTCMQPRVKINSIWIKNCLAFFRQNSEKKNQLYSLNQICSADSKKSFIWPIEMKKIIHFAPWFENHVVH